MITKIYGYNIKGQEFEQEVGQYTIFAGPNGVGKTVRTQTMQLAILGHVPGMNRTLQDIFNAFSTGPKMAVAVEVGGKVFKRIFEKKKDAVNQTVLIDGNKTNAKDFPIEMRLAGCPEVFMADSFMQLSEKARFTEMLRVFPPAGNLENVNTTIRGLKDKINAAQRNKESLTGTIARLEDSRKNLNLPLGSLDETEMEIRANNSALEELSAQRIKVVKAKAKADAEEKARIQKERELAEAKALLEKQAKEAEEAKQKAIEIAAEKSRVEALKEVEAQRRQEEAMKPAPDVKPSPPVSVFTPVLPQPETTPSVANKFLASLDRIEKVMANAGCDECAAKLVIGLVRREYQWAV